MKNKTLKILKLLICLSILLGMFIIPNKSVYAVTASDFYITDIVKSGNNVTSFKVTFSLPRGQAFNGRVALHTSSTLGITYPESSKLSADGTYWQSHQYRNFRAAENPTDSDFYNWISEPLRFELPRQNNSFTINVNLNDNPIDVTENKTYFGYLWVEVPGKCYPDSQLFTLQAGNGELTIGPAKTQYTVNFDENGHGTAPEAQLVTEGNTVTKPDDLTEEGFTFEGWYTDSEGTTAYDFTTPVTSDITLFAKWTPVTTTQYTVTFNANGHGTAPEAQLVTEGNTVTKPEDLAEEGFTFEGWFLDAEGTTAYDFETPVTSDITIYAKWTEKAEESPQTGDNIMLYYSIIGVAVAGIIASVVITKKRR